MKACNTRDWSKSRNQATTVETPSESRSSLPFTYKLRLTRIPVAAQTLHVQLCNSQFDTVLTVLKRTGKTSAGIQTVLQACNDDSCNIQSAVYNVPVVRNTLYYFVSFPTFAMARILRHCRLESCPHWNLKYSSTTSRGAKGQLYKSLICLCV